MASFKAALVLLAICAPLAVLACDTPVGVGACLDCPAAKLGWARIPAAAGAAAGLGSYFEFGYTIVTNANGGQVSSSASAGSRNYEYLTVSTMLANSIGGGDSAGSVDDCCKLCANTAGCLYYVYYPDSPVSFTGSYPITGAGAPISSKGKGVKPNTIKTFSFSTDVVSSLPSGVSTRCNLLKGPRPSTYAFDGDANPTLGATNPKTIIGGSCNPQINDDPHLVGARGTKFDFNGGLHQPYCLITDKHMHINVMLDGYAPAAITETTTAAPAKKLRTWIKEVGLVWNHEGVQHTAVLTARKGKQQERGDGFLASVVLNGESLALPAVGETIIGAGLFNMTFVAQEKKHIFDVDHYTLSAGDIFEMDARMRVAHPSLQSADDAEAHFNLGFSNIEDSPSVHGVLGQTYRTTVDQSERAAKYQALAASLNGPLFADGENGKGFLDGETSDYVSSGILAADCKFTAYTKPTPSISSE